MTEREAYIALNMMDGIGPVSVRILVSTIGAAVGIFEAREEDILRIPGLSRDVVSMLLKQRDSINWQAEIEKANSMGIEIITYIEDRYPASLKQIHDPPLALYVKGKIECADSQAIAIVGTRNPTHYGLQVAEMFGFQLARAGFVIVSGLAKGIDASAHSGAIKSHGRTLAVLGGGIDKLSPHSNEALAELIVENGALISEYPLGRPPDKTTFPVRNRIVSGLSMGVIVVEAGHKSGALITARVAAEQGKIVFAVPGRIDSSRSFGTNMLIKEGARLVQSVDDVLREFEYLSPALLARSDVFTKPKPVLSEAEEKIVRLIDSGITDIDSLIRASGLGVSTVNSLLIELEMKRIVHIAPGRIVELVGNIQTG